MFVRNVTPRLHANCIFLQYTLIKSFSQYGTGDSCGKLRAGVSNGDIGYLRGATWGGEIFDLTERHKTKRVVWFGTLVGLWENAWGNGLERRGNITMQHLQYWRLGKLQVFCPLLQWDSCKRKTRLWHGFCFKRLIPHNIHSKLRWQALLENVVIILLFKKYSTLYEAGVFIPWSKRSETSTSLVPDESRKYLCSKIF
jgi:hypothetical protein